MSIRYSIDRNNITWNTMNEFLIVNKVIIKKQLKSSIKFEN